MALGVAGDADPPEGAAQLGQGVQQGQCAVVGAGGRVGVAGGYEDVVHAGVAEPVHDVLQVDVVPDQPGGHVGHDGVPVRREPAGEVQRGLQALDRDAVTVTATSRGTWATTWSSVDLAGSTS